MRERANGRYVDYQGQRWVMSHLAAHVGMHPATLFMRIWRLHWPIEKAVSQPVRARRCKQRAYRRAGA